MIACPSCCTPTNMSNGWDRSKISSLSRSAAFPDDLIEIQPTSESFGVKKKVPA